MRQDIVEIIHITSVLIDEFDHDIEVIWNIRRRAQSLLKAHDDKGDS